MTHRLSITLLLLASIATSAQTASPPSQQPAFDVASIRQNLSDEHASSHIVSSSNDGRFTAINVPLKSLLQFAFGLPDTQIVGGPASLLAEKFDIQAKSDDSVNAQMAKLASVEGKLQKQRMLQALFADRFKLITHSETRELPVYALMVAKNGPTLHASPTGSRTYNEGRSHLDDSGATTAVLAEQLARILSRPVINHTGLTGQYDLTLKWTQDNDPVTDNASPSIFTAVQEQLGLKLEPAKTTVEVLVIDHIEQPSEN